MIEPTVPRTSEEWFMALLDLANVARQIASYDVPKMIELAGRADSLGPILYPTLYKAKHRDLEFNVELLNAALPLFRLAQKLATPKLGNAAEAIKELRAAGLDAWDDVDIEETLGRG